MWEGGLVAIQSTAHPDIRIDEQHYLAMVRYLKDEFFMLTRKRRRSRGSHRPR